MKVRLYLTSELHLCQGKHRIVPSTLLPLPCENVILSHLEKRTNGHTLIVKKSPIIQLALNTPMVYVLQL